MHPKIEKYLLRKAFDTPAQPYLPEDVLWRQKEQFSDGVGYDWVDRLKEYSQEARAAPQPRNPLAPALKSCFLQCGGAPGAVCITAAVFGWEQWHL